MGLLAVGDVGDFNWLLKASLDHFDQSAAEDDDLLGKRESVSMVSVVSSIYSFIHIFIYSL